MHGNSNCQTKLALRRACPLVVTTFREHTRASAIDAVEILSNATSDISVCSSGSQKVLFTRLCVNDPRPEPQQTLKN